MFAFQVQITQPFSQSASQSAISCFRHSSLTINTLNRHRKPIVENITEAIYCSRKTICVISQHYLQSEWCSKEIQMASFRLFNEHKDVMIMVFLEDIPAKQLSPYFQIRSLVKKRSYLSWPQAVHHTGVFWQKIQQALKREENPAEHRCLLTGYQRVIQ
ncbi:toll-like receptor 13 isoform X1 [Pundamilia nyererei]|uniref:Toll-like receptor 13 isoform X1 n=1 Tax=Pundamilia nyererei TaxID=303518 RepID=A0A9Y3S176_9CICH|nr:PREDICTED: toll-like receptor 13 isoform X1 [Pundamilia nyererei]